MEGEGKGEEDTPFTIPVRWGEGKAHEKKEGGAPFRSIHHKGEGMQIPFLVQKRRNKSKGGETVLLSPQKGGGEKNLPLFPWIPLKKRDSYLYSPLKKGAATNSAGSN